MITILLIIGILILFIIIRRGNHKYIREQEKFDRELNKEIEEWADEFNENYEKMDNERSAKQMSEIIHFNKKYRTHVKYKGNEI